MRKFLVAFLLLFITIKVQAQTWEIGGAIGAAGYIGDLNVNNPVKPSGGFAGLFVKRNFNRYLGVKLSYSFAQISGADSTSSSRQFRDRNLSFKTPLNELSLMGEFNFMSYIPDAGKNKYTPYIYLGAGVTSYAPRAVLDDKLVGLRALRTEGQSNPYATTTIVIPFGAGVKYNFSGKWTVAADLGYRYTTTDYLDDVSGLYADPSRLSSAAAVKLADRSGEKTHVYIGTPGTQRGDFKPRDYYLFVGFTLSYTFVTSACYY
ncbi:DUF6089 family protein [Mucilaginibacter sp. AK015]|uniref:type IX secretion system protein PorG n=1 Tax=Mucilaginibacter sp. AK015 TaxID=2723072 RepID=UPI00161C77B7|nr:DUF6089 family protein [Mucilaginibacter sp. AK015]MBB5395606.1 opacity protein-like surface antigen [Mucilaginibacter sp. AK015]